MGRPLLILKYRWWIILLTLCLCLGCVFPLLKIKINSDLESYLPASMSAKKQNSLIENAFGRDDAIVLVFSAEDILKDTSLKRIRALSREFSRMKQFDMVMSIFDAKTITGEEGYMQVNPAIIRIPRGPEARENLREKLKANKLVYNILISKDFKHSLLILNNTAVSNDKEVMARVHETLKKFPGEEQVTIFGQPYLRDEANQKISRDLLLLLPLGLLIMFVFLWISLGEIKMVLLPFAVVIISILFSMSLIPFFGWEISIIGVLIPIMMIAIANNYGVHVVARDQELRSRYPRTARNRLVQTVVLFLIKPVVFTGLTTIAGIAGLIMHIMIPARQMGIVTALGIALALLLSLTFIPAAMSMQNAVRHRFRREENKGSIISSLLLIISRYSALRPRTVILFFSVVLFLSLFLLPGLKVATDFNRILPQKHSFNRALSIINKEFGGAKYISLMFPGDAKDPVQLKKLDLLEERLANMPEVGNVTSMASIIRIMSRALNDPQDKQYDNIPTSRDAISQYLEFYSMSGDPDDFERFVNIDYTNTRMSIQYSGNDLNTMNSVIDQIQAHSKRLGLKPIMGGYSLVEKELSLAVTLGQRDSLIFAFLAIALLLILIFRNLIAGLLGSLPLLFAILCTFGIMSLTGTELDIVTALLSSISIGLGVDYTIHILWRLKKEIKQHPTMEEAVIKSVTTTGRGIAINAFSVMVGFTVLFFSAFPLVRSFAFLIISSIALCLLCALILIPAICVLLKPGFLMSKKIIK